MNIESFFDKIVNEPTAKVYHDLHGLCFGHIYALVRDGVIVPDASISIVDEDGKSHYNVTGIRVYDRDCAQIVLAERTEGER